jgi:hypothetical protein
MTNDRAAEIMKAIIFMLPNEYDSDEVEEAIHMAINALQAQDLNKQVTGKLNSADDTISRQAAIDAVDEALTRVFVEHRDIAEKMINKVPSAQPQLTGRWIPCTKNGLPLSEMAYREGQKWYGYKCSNCNFIYKGNALTESPYCKKCGARMEEEK